MGKMDHSLKFEDSSGDLQLILIFCDAKSIILQARLHNFQCFDQSWNFFAPLRKHDHNITPLNRRDLITPMDYRSSNQRVVDL